MTEGKKFDGGKPRWSLLPEGAVPSIIEVLEFGAKKYAENNWQLVPDGKTRYYDAAMRHLEAWRHGELNDPETGLPHLAHAGCCLMFLGWLDKQHSVKQEAVETESEWLKWLGGYRPPVENSTVVRVKTRGGWECTQTAKEVMWLHNGSFRDIVKYQVIKEAVKQEAEWHKWSGGIFPPVRSSESVEFKLRGGTKGRGFARNLQWIHTGDSLDVVAFQIIK